MQETEDLSRCHKHHLLELSYVLPQLLLSLSIPLDLTPLGLPLAPTARELADRAPKPCLPRQSRRRPRPHTGLAIENHLVRRTWLRPAKAVLELVGAQEEAVGGAGDGQVPRPRDLAGRLEFGGFADVDQDPVGRGRARQGLDVGEAVDFRLRRGRGGAGDEGGGEVALGLADGHGV